MLALLDQESQDAVNGVKPCGCARVRLVCSFEIGRVEIIEVRFLRNCKEMTRDLTAEERCAIVVAH